MSITLTESAKVKLNELIKVNAEIIILVTQRLARKPRFLSTGMHGKQEETRKKIKKKGEKKKVYTSDKKQDKKGKKEE